MGFDELFEPEPGSVALAEWVWCMHCCQGHPRLAWEAKNLNCPTPACDGMALDALPWDLIRRQNPDYPQAPEEGVRYPMYQPGH